MQKRDKVGLAIIVVLLLVLAATLVWTFRPASGPTHDFSESRFVKQRINNLKK